MDKVDHIYALHQLLRRRRTPVTRPEITRELECSVPTVYRTIETMRTHLQAPIVNDRESGGYYYSRDNAGIRSKSGNSRPTDATNSESPIATSANLSWTFCVTAPMLK